MPPKADSMRSSRLQARRAVRPATEDEVIADTDAEAVATDTQVEVKEDAAGEINRQTQERVEAPSHNAQPQASLPSPTPISQRDPASATSNPTRHRERLASVLPPNSTLPPPRDVSTTSMPQSTAAPSASRLKYAPKPTARQTKSEREALAESMARKPRGPDGGGLSARGRGVGSRRPVLGSGGSNNAVEVASGPMGGGVAREKNSSRGRGRGRGGKGATAEHGPNVDGHEAEGSAGDAAGGSSVAATVGSGLKGKDATATDTPTIQSSSISTTKRASTTSRARIKKEPDAPTYFSDEAEWDEDDPAPRVDIAHINLLSDNDQSADDEKDADIRMGGTGGTNASIDAKRRDSTAAKARPPATWQLRPVRLDREEHIERQVGVNTDASSAMSAQLRKRAKEKRGKEEGMGLFVGGDEDVAKRGRRGKGKDVEVVGGVKRWQGVWQADEEDDEDDVVIKEETIDDQVQGEGDVDMGAASAVPVMHEDAMNVDDGRSATRIPDAKATNGVGSAEDEGTTPSIGRARKPKSPATTRRRLKVKGYRNAEAIYRADATQPADYRDTEFTDMVDIWKKYHKETEKAAAASSRKSSTGKVDKEKIGDSMPTDLKGNPAREGKIYILQLPPIMPKLHHRPKPESDDSHQTNGQRPSTTTTTDLKPDSGVVPPSNALDTPAIDPLLSDAYTVTTLSPPTGRAGTLTVYEGGIMIADWGGTSLEIRPEAHRSSMAQEVILMPQERVMTKVEGGDDKWEEIVTVGGPDKQAWAVGQVEGGLIAEMDWDAMLG